MWKYRRLFGAPPTISIPPELANEATLLSHLAVSSRELKKIWYYRGTMYHHFAIAKGNGKARLISAPDSNLKHIQRKIARLLGQIYSPRNPVHGFVNDRSVKTNAEAHLRRSFVLNIDLKDFFPSITEKRVYGVLWAIGVDERVAEILARLCCNNGHIPQGAPSSPVLSNMICFRMDKRLLALAKATRCIYTRYADDITFSSYQALTSLFDGPVPPAGRFSPDLLSVPFKAIFSDNGFNINPDKVHYADRHSRRMVTGLKVNELLNVDRRFVRNIRSALYSVKVHGAEKVQQLYQEKYGGTSSVVSHIKGKIEWLRHIRGQSDPVFRGIAVRFNDCFPEHKLDVEPTSDEVRNRSVWLVEHGHAKPEGKQGTAFFLKGVGLVTAAHCVDGATTDIEVYHPSKPANKFKVGMLKLDEHRDLALLKHSIPETEYFELERSARSVAVGATVIALGYPSFGPGDHVSMRPGAITSLPVKSLVQKIEVSQKLVQGMSGGPVLDDRDKVIGIIHKGGPGEDRDLAVNIEMLNEWLELA
jgi:retron-type reverse transcriptase